LTETSTDSPGTRSMKPTVPLAVIVPVSRKASKAFFASAIVCSAKSRTAGVRLVSVMFGP